MNWILLISAIAAAQGAFIIPVLRKKMDPDHFRALLPLLLVLIFTLIARVAYAPLLSGQFTQVALLSDVVLFLYGPLLLLYFSKVFDSIHSKRKSFLWHFLPALVHLALNIPLLLMSRIDYVQQLKNQQFDSFFLAITVVAWVHNAAYFIYLVYQFGGNLKSKETDQRLTQFLRRLMVCIGIILLIWMSSNGHAIITNSLPSNQFFQGIWIALSLTVFVICYYSLLYEGRFKQKRMMSIDHQFIHRIEKLLVQNELFRNPELRLPLLAEKLNTNTLFLSRAINEHYECNFPDYLNKLRIRAFLQMANSEQFAHLTHWAIAEKAGFNSKTAFYRAFKKEKQVTPSEFLRNGASA